MIKAIVFDVGGVLRNTSETFDFVFRKVFEEFGLKYSFKTLGVWHLRGFGDLNPRRAILRALLCISRSGENLADIIKRKDAEEYVHNIIKAYTKPDDDALIERMAQRYVYWFYENPESRKYTKIMPYVKEVIEALPKKYTLAVLTDSRLSLTEKWLQDIGIRKYFKCIIGEEELKNKKPDPEGLLLVAKTLGVKPKEMLYIGDSAHDILAAKNAGCKSAAVLTGMGFAHVLRTEKPDFVFRDLNELCDSLMPNDN
ncbi:Phosphoglycolate phosphatase [uncultured archaeon]|nr:Phosphoglycolate phosphatase [uncultured archaeon]